MEHQTKFIGRMVMNIKKILIYLAEWLIPSSTAIYIIAAANFTWGTYLFWGYAMNIPAYLIACMAGACIYYPVNRYIFKNRCEAIDIIVNTKHLTVNNGDIIETVFDGKKTSVVVWRKHD